MANILTVKELHRRHHADGISTAAFHPGIVATGFSAGSRSPLKLLYRSVLNRVIRSPEQGAETLVWLASGRAGVDWPSGGYFADHALARTSRLGFLRAAKELALARKYAERLDLRAAALSVPVGTLSGGNQQKVVIGKWLATQPKVIILDEPTKGIDIGSKAAVHAFISELAAEGLSIIMISSELPEIIGMSDRVLVMKEGLSAGLFDRDRLTPEVLVRAATGNA